MVNLYPSVPVNKAFDVLIDQLNNDKDDLMKRTQFFQKYNYELTELFPSKCYFLYNKEIRILKNSGPLGLFVGSFIRKLRSELGTQSH